MEQPTSGVGVLDKSMAVLSGIAEHPMNLAELTNATGLPRATAHRLALALAAHRLLTRDGDGRFVLGERISELAATMPDELVIAATPVLAWVRDESGESAQLYRRDGATRICAAAAERAHGLRTTVPVGTRLPMNAGSGAQVLSAFAADGDGTAAEFAVRILADVRRRGWAQSVGQREAGVASVSAPVLTSDGVLLAAISISGPVERLGRSPGARFGPLLVSGAHRITAARAATTRRG